MKERNKAALIAPLVAAALSWVAACSWRGMVEQPNRYTGPAFVVAVLVALVGIAARFLRLRWYAVLPLQLVVVLVWLHHHLHADQELGGWLPTPHGVSEVVHQIHTGISQINTYAAPVPFHYTAAPVYLLAASILVTVLVDLIACGFRMPAWSGLPVLVALTIPISVLDGGLPAPVYIGSGLLFALLLAVSEADRAIAWGQAMIDRDTIDPDYQSVPVGVLSSRALGVGATATVVALVLSLGVPVGDGLFRHHDGKDGGGNGPGSTVTLSNPLADLRRDLVRNNHLPLLNAETTSKDTSYVRLTVLDQFKDGAWVPSARKLDARNIARGDLPAPLGVQYPQSGSDSEWSLETTSAFRTTWLPTPFPTRSIFIDKGDWRYDATQLDIASVGDDPPTDVTYRLNAFSPRLTSEQLARTAPPPVAITDAMTRLPNLPKQVVDIAEQVTASGRTEYDKVALLQSWFRVGGGFTYSLRQRAGGGLSQLARFLTTDKTGYCEQFAAAMAIMARSLGIPARVVVGFLSPKQLDPNKYLYTSDDLHAWPEIYFTNYGWVRFEPTPSARTGLAPSWTVGQVDAPTAAVPTPTATASSTPKGPKKEAPAPKTSSASASDSSASTIVVALLVLTLLVLLLAAPALVRSRQRARRLRPAPEPRASAENLWAELHATAIDHGIPWPTSRSPRMVADVLGPRVLRSAVGYRTTADRDRLDALVSLVERARYSPEFAPGDEQLAATAETVRRWSELMAGAVTVNRARMARFFPTSLMRERREEPDSAGADQLTEVGR